MKITHSLSPSGLRLYFDGELDQCCEKKAKMQIDSLIEKYSNTRAVFFNMQALKFMDSTGIGVLIGRYKKLKSMNIPCYIENPSFSADKVFIVSGIYKLIPKL